MKQIISTSHPDIPPGFIKFPLDKGKYKESVIGRETDYEKPVWAEKKRDSEGVYYALYTIREIK
jgi:hypothetical protein